MVLYSRKYNIGKQQQVNEIATEVKKNSKSDKGYNKYKFGCKIGLFSWISSNNFDKIQSDTDEDGILIAKRWELNKKRTVQSEITPPCGTSFAQLFF
jgi:hypothetical protein